MSLNRLYNIFGSDRLGRKDVQTYGQSTDETVRNAIEQKTAGSSFDADAIEGWEELSYDTGALSNLDKKFGTPPSTGIFKIIGGTAAVGAIAVTIYFTMFYSAQPDPVIAENTRPEIITTLMEDQEITLDESDIVFPEPIEKMHPAPTLNQVQPKEIIKDQHDRIILKKEEPQIKVENLPPHEIENDPTPLIIRDHKLAKEIYLHDLKLIDYRKYRSKPVVKTRQMILTGLPANMEDQDSDTLDPMWRDVDVPYIEYLDKSIKIFERSRYKRALTRFETILETYPKDANANFYSGVCLFNLGEYDKAITRFNSCLNGKFSNFDEEALWMNAESFDLSGNKSEARTLYKKIVEQKGYYADQAARRLK
jgi:TolA-binding protein